MPLLQKLVLETVKPTMPEPAVVRLSMAMGAVAWPGVLRTSRMLAAPWRTRLVTLRVASGAPAVPCAMVFVPCKDGVSHNELEDATQLDCAAGGNVLLHTVLALAGVAS